MLDIHFVRENPEVVKASEKKRGHDPQKVDEVLAVDTMWKESIAELEKLKHEKNIVSEKINSAKKSENQATFKQKIQEMQIVATKIKEGEDKTKSFFNQREELLSQIGNIMHPDVPKGKNDTENVEIKTWGEKRTDKVRNHVEFIEELGLADFESSAKVSGNGFYFLKNELALLNQALIRFATQFLTSKGYTYIEPPLMINKEILDAAIDTEEFDNTIYSIADEKLAMIATSEHAILGMHKDNVFEEKDLPKKYAGYSMCFRKEIGSHGINEKGLWRTHQFNKVEQFIFCKPEDSPKYFEELLKNSEEILQALKLPYRIIELCSGDLSLWKHKSYDLEVWRPTTQSYGEIMSLSNITDYQSRELGIKVVINQKRKFVHTLNNTAIATSRILVAILENYQTKDGIDIPKVLWPYMNGITRITKITKK